MKSYSKLLNLILNVSVYKFLKFLRTTNRDYINIYIYRYKFNKV